MISSKITFETIDEYINTFPKEVKQLLEEVRKTIHKAAPLAEEAISYQIPTFKLKGNLVHFAAFNNHIGFYPGSKAIEVFSKELKEYKTSKGAIQFPLDKKIPYALITKITKSRVIENLNKPLKKK
ncbi:MAG: DUF1801 domain-containing protein [Ignavibacteriales bacterium]|nr:MAG: DUF1801 domain-containing protein [Ignavibacteriales bacterium]